MALLRVFGLSMSFLLFVGCGHDAPPIETPVSDAETYRAIGQEPGWSVRFFDDRIVMEMNYGEETLTFSPPPEPVALDGYTQYNLSSNGPDSAMKIYEEVCADVMSGMTYPNRVTVTVDDNTYEGCGGDPRDLLTGGEWIVEDLGGGGVIDKAQTSLNFDQQGRVSGSGACNRFNAAYRLTGEGISFGPIAATKKACPPAVMAQEALFFEILAAVTNFNIAEDGALVLSGAGRAITARR